MREISSRCANWSNYLRGPSICQMESWFQQVPEEMRIKGELTAEIMVIIAQNAKGIYDDPELNKEAIKGITIGGKWYDIGMAKLSNDIRRQRRKLTDDERDLYRSHPLLTTEIFDQIIDNTKVSPKEDSWWCVIYDCALEHHERWDGYGYPFGLEGDGIHIMSRICSLADWYVGKIMESHDKAALHEAAMCYIHKQAGSQFDPLLAKVMLHSGRRIYNRIRGEYCAICI